MTQRRLCALALGSVVLVAGCGTVVPGTATPAREAAPSRPLGELLLEPEAFPPAYPAVVLPAQAVSQAAPDLTGIATGARVVPPGCRPPQQDYGPNGTAMVVGTDSVTRSTITVELVRAGPPLAELEAQLVECPDVTATANGVDVAVRTTVTPPPGIEADDTLALRRTVESGRQGGTVTQSMLTLIAQVDDVRIQVTYMSFGDEPGGTDAAILDELFTTAVQKVRTG